MKIKAFIGRVLNVVKQNATEYFSLGKTLIARLENDICGLLKNHSANQSKVDETTNLLILKYSGDCRFYHNLSHVRFLLQHAENFKERFEDYESVRLAVWFHDAIYEPKSLTNEIDSARLAVEKLSMLNFPKAKITAIEKMVLATQKHDASELGFDGKLFLDLDLGILGAEEKVYRKYSKAIRREYSFVPEDIYRAKRSEILRRFLEREFIYYTNEFRETLEDQARSNIANEIKELS